MGGYVGLAPAGFPNVALSNLAKEFRNNKFVGDILAPRVPVERQSFQYVVWDRDDFRAPSTLRAPGTAPATIRDNYSTDTYFCRSHALDASIPFESEAYSLGLGFSARQKATKRLANRLNLAREVEIAAMALSTVNFPNGVSLTNPAVIAAATPASQWDTYPAVMDQGYDGSHPIAAVNALKALIRQAGVEDGDMFLILSDPVVTALQSHPDVVGRFRYAVGGSISLEDLTEVFKVKCIQASAVQVSENNVASWVWGTNAFLGFSQPNPDMQDVSCMKTFGWTGAQDGGLANGLVAPGADGFAVLEWVDPHLSKKTYWQSADWYYGLKVTAQETGIPILNAVAAPVMGAIPADVEG
ncbi:MAG: hypothetical protein ACLQG3_14650 [Terracidiphilus sp.]